MTVYKSRRLQRFESLNMSLCSCNEEQHGYQILKAFIFGKNEDEVAGFIKVTNVNL